jgi:hypothetical protein
VALAGCGSSRGTASGLEAAIYLVALPIYAIACAGGGCRSGNTTTDWEANFAEQCGKAEAGDANSRLAVGNHFRYGYKPVDRDDIEAYKWYSLIIAADKNKPQSDFTQFISRHRESLATGMSGDQIVEAERRVSAWTPNNCKPKQSLQAAEPRKSNTDDGNVGFSGPKEDGTKDLPSCTNPDYADLLVCREWLAAWNAAHSEGLPPPSPVEPLQGTATAMPSTPSYNAPAASAPPTAPARIAAPSTAPSVQGPAATPQTGTPVGDSPSAPLVDPVGRCAPSVRHLGGSYCVTDPNRS